MRVIVRADASTAIGGGHMMRCLTLAAALAGRGAVVTFAVREGSVETVPLLAQAVYEFIVLEGSVTDEAREAEQRFGHCDWLIVDHYGLDEQFEQAARGFAGNIMVIDDLADRPHDCDMLLDQTYGRKSEDYQGFVPDHARLLMGAEFALLRPQFSRMRPKALARRQQGGPMRRMLVSLGASDPQGLTGKLLHAISETGMNMAVDIVIGAADPKELGLTQFAETMLQEVAFHGFGSDMAELMCQADVAIGAAGSSAWERCCLGLPTLMAVLADNQKLVADGLDKAGAVRIAMHSEFADPGRLAASLTEFVMDNGRLQEMSAAAAEVCDGRGAERIAEYMFGKTEQPST